MDQYKISQNPTPGNKAKGKKKVKAKKFKGPKHSGTRLNPKLVAGTLIGVAILVLGGVGWARWFGGSHDNGANGQSSKGTVTTPKGTVSNTTYNTVTSAVANKQPSALNALYASRVHVYILGTGVNRSVNASEVGNLLSDPLNGASDPWNWHVSPADLAAWQTGPYGQYFTGNDLIGESANGDVISVSVDSNGQIDSIFVAPVGDLTGGTTTGGTTGSGDSSGTGGSTTGSGSNNNGSGSGSGSGSTSNPDPNGAD